MKHINSLSKAHGVDSPVGIAIMMLDNFKNARTSKTLKRFC
jgi:hypothetical protein